MAQQYFRACGRDKELTTSLVSSWLPGVRLVVLVNLARLGKRSVHLFKPGRRDTGALLPYILVLTMDSNILTDCVTVLFM